MTKRRKYEAWETTNSKITPLLRRLWLWSKERRFALKQAKNCCSKCGVKASKRKGAEVKIEVHHIKPCNFDKIYKVIRQELLVNPSKLKVLCVDCHKKLHDKERSKK